MGRAVEVTITCDFCKREVKNHNSAIHIPHPPGPSWYGANEPYFCSWWCVSNYAAHCSDHADDRPQIARQASEFTLDAIADDGFRQKVVDRLGSLALTWFHYPHPWLRGRSPALMVAIGEESELRYHAGYRLEEASIERWKEQLTTRGG